MMPAIGGTTTPSVMQEVDELVEDAGGREQRAEHADDQR